LNVYGDVVAQVTSPRARQSYRSGLPYFTHAWQFLKVPPLTKIPIGTIDSGRGNLIRVARMAMPPVPDSVRTMLRIVGRTPTSPASGRGKAAAGSSVIATPIWRRSGDQASDLRSMIPFAGLSASTQFRFARNDSETLKPYSSTILLITPSSTSPKN
jgi:hypothetical protein